MKNALFGKYIWLLLYSFLKPVFFVFVLMNSLNGQNTTTCFDEIKIAKNATITYYDRIPNSFNKVVIKGENVLLLTSKIKYTEALFLATFWKDKWAVWEIKDYVGDLFVGELQVLKIEGIRDWLVYVKWQHKDGGSGLGSWDSGKILWSMNGQTCYLNAIDRSNYYEKIYEGTVPNQKLFRRNKRYYCRISISNEGIKISQNNTCKNKFRGIEGMEQISHDRVGKYRMGQYIYQKGSWIKKEN